jgi:sec-independent protein translocase protein TatA
MTAAPQILAGVLGLGAPELIVILIILLVLFGGSKLPSLAKGLGQSIKEFKNASKDEPAADKSAGSATIEKPADPKKIETAKTHGAN